MLRMERITSWERVHGKAAEQGRRAGLYALFEGKLLSSSPASPSQA